MHSPWAGGVILVAFAVLALILANIPQTAGVYHHLLESHLTVGFDHFRLSKPLEAWINDGLMVIFFFYVGLEIKREIIAGQLSGVRRAALPVAAAIGGMAVPALIYVLINRSGDFLSGWGIPMATDIAFAIGILSLLGNRVPVSLKVFLMALAVVDDLGGILVIAVFYSTDIQVGMLVAAAVVFVFMILLKRLNVYKMRYYLILSIVMWILFLYSGIHATIAGVLIALTIPSTPRFTKRYFSYKTRYYLRSFRRHDREGVQVLSNRKPPYSIAGGLYDALKATDGEMFALTNAHARKARRLFLELEGVDIYSAAGIATASLIKAVEEGKIAKDAVVMLNITGGGELHFKEDKTLWYLKPDHVFPIDPDPEEVIAKTEALFA